jgi:hypothetical protein
MSSICITVIGVLSSENFPFPERPSHDGASVEEWGLPRSAVRAVGIGLSRLLFSNETTKANKNQQLTAGGFWTRQQISTNINTVSKSQQKSAKISKNQQKSTLNSQETERNKHLETKISICEHRGLDCGPTSLPFLRETMRIGT